MRKTGARALSPGPNTAGGLTMTQLVDRLTASSPNSLLRPYGVIGPSPHGPEADWLERWMKVAEGAAASRAATSDLVTAALARSKLSWEPADVAPARW